jgi:DNA-binding MarR family transcriptional regulator
LFSKWIFLKVKYLKDARVPETLFANTNLPPEFKAMIGVFALVNQIDALLMNINVSPPVAKMERKILVFLDRPKRMGALAEDIFCVPSAVTPAADTLERCGLVRRIPDPQDRRAMLLELTDAGTAAREDFMAQVVNRFREISGMAPEEIKTFAGLAIKSMPSAVEAGLMKDRDE